MIAQKLIDHLTHRSDHVLSWASTFTEEQRSQISEPTIALEIDKLAALDAWQRGQRFRNGVLAAIDRHMTNGEGASARFWLEELDAGIGAESAARDALVDMFGSEIALQHALSRNPLAPSSAALVGYFTFQAAHGDARLVTLLPLVLRWQFAVLSPEGAGQDAMAVALGAVPAQIDGVFNDGDAALLLWTLDFTGLCLREAQAWVASGVLGRRA